MGFIKKDYIRGIVQKEGLGQFADLRRCGSKRKREGGGFDKGLIPNVHHNIYIYIYVYIYMVVTMLTTMLLCYPPQKIFFSSASSFCHLSVCSVVFVYFQLLLRVLLLLTFVQSFRKLKFQKRLFAFWILFIIISQHYFEEKIVELYIRERLFIKKMHQNKGNAEMLCKIWFVHFVACYQVV